MSHDQHLCYDSITHDDPSQIGLQLPKKGSRTDDGELLADLNEDLDENVCFERLHSPNYQAIMSIRKYNRAPPLHRRCTSSLLTQALLTNSESLQSFNGELSSVTTQEVLTSSVHSTLPSPPPAQSIATELSPSVATLACQDIATNESSFTRSVQSKECRDKPAEKAVEAGLGRRRCITFACGRQAAPITNKEMSSTETSGDISKSGLILKRPRLLRFACPTKPSLRVLGSIEPDEIHHDPLQTPISSTYQQTMSNSYSNQRRHRGPRPAHDSGAKANEPINLQPTRNGQTPRISNRTKLEQSEATRFHEFAGRFDVDDEWINQPMAPRQKITVNDTLRKENDIRRLAEEAEEESLEEDGDHAADLLENLGKSDDVDDFASDDDASNGGNESDNEEGFADSDVDSDQGSQYEFWTPGVTTAATSLDFMEHIRPIGQRVASDSSLDSLLKSHEKAAGYKFSNRCSRDVGRPRKSPRMRPGTPDLPDSTDFVCGTLDEDRPLEAAYLSCLEERRRSRHKIIPQDIDPSFPTSEPEADEDDVNENGLLSDENTWVLGHPDNSDEELSSRKKNDVPRKMGRSAMPSPKRARLPAPRRGIIHRSPPPRRLFGRSPGDLRDTSEFHPKLHSPPSTRRTSFCKSPRHESKGIAVSHLAQRPHPTHTTSLPRTPNPFWRQHRKGHDHDDDETSTAAIPPKADLRSRGPIEIVRGLESRRQRRKEKLSRQHCRHAGKEKERKCQPGKGAERMRELGLEMANKAREYGQKGDLILSV